VGLTPFYMDPGPSMRLRSKLDRQTTGSFAHLKPVQRGRIHIDSQNSNANQIATYFVGYAR
jgi:hypothetical protein